MFDVDLYTPRGAASSCHAIFRGFQKVSIHIESSLQRVVMGT